MLTVEVKVNGALFKGDPSRVAIVVNEELTAAMHASTQHIRGLIIPRTPVFQGHLRQATQASVTGVARSIEGRVFNTLSAYNLSIEHGWQSSKGKQPPSSALELWVRRKLGVPENRVKSVAFLVARKIGKRGTKAVKMFSSSFEESRGTINALFNRASDRVVARLS